MWLIGCLEAARTQTRTQTSGSLLTKTTCMPGHLLSHVTYRVINTGLPVTYMGLSLSGLSEWCVTINSSRTVLLFTNGSQSVYIVLNVKVEEQSSDEALTIYSSYRGFRGVFWDIRTHLPWNCWNLQNKSVRWCSLAHARAIHITCTDAADCLLRSPFTTSPLTVLITVCLIMLFVEYISRWHQQCHRLVINIIMTFTIAHYSSREYHWHDTTAQRHLPMFSGCCTVANH